MHTSLFAELLIPAVASQDCVRAGSTSRRAEIVIILTFVAIRLSIDNNHCLENGP